MFNLTEAKRNKAKLRLAIDGPSGSGKTYSALLIAFGITHRWDKIAVIDTERESANLYSDLCDDDSNTGKYLTGQINSPFSPQKYMEAIEACEKAEIEVIIIDSLTHAWTAEGGLLDIHENAMKKQNTQNGYTAWGDVTPLHRKLVDKILTSPCHIICTVRSETEYAQEKDNNGRTKIVKVGMKPQFRKGLDYEMTIVLSLGQDHFANVSKSRIKDFPVNDKINPTKETGEKLLAWLNEGDDIPICTDCGNPIEAYGKMSAMEVALYSQRKFGKTLCAECGKNEKELNYEDDKQRETPKDIL